jgi:hypothetical protein
MLGSSRLVLESIERIEVIFVKFSKPLVEGFSCNAVVTSYLRGILPFMISYDPSQTISGFFGYLENMSYLSPAIMLFSDTYWEEGKELPEGEYEIWIF